MEKRATRWKGEFIDSNGNVVWEGLFHDDPPSMVKGRMLFAGIKFRRVRAPSDTNSGPVWSPVDPVNSIIAALNHAPRRETQKNRLVLLLLHNVGEWLLRDDVIRVAGSQGDRRGRELRKAGWPIEMQIRKDEPWPMRLVLSDEILDELRERGIL